MVIAYTRASRPALRFESLSPPPAETLWPDSDEDADADLHISKKRRIESLGQQYLQGRPLFILSAGLRGPLDEEWVNPWARRKETGRVQVRGEGLEPLKTRNVTISPSKSAPDALPHKQTLAAASTQTSAGDLEKDGVAVAHHNTLAHREQNMAEGKLPLVQTDKDKSCIPFGKDEILKALPPTAELAEALAKRPVDYSRPKETTWLKSNTTILRGGSHTKSKSPTPTPVSLRSDDSLLEHREPPQCGIETSPAASKAEAKQPEPPASPTLLGFTPINVPRRTDKQPALKTIPETSTRHVKGGRRKKDVSTDRPPGVTEKTLLQADIEIREGYLCVKRLSQEAIRHAELQDAYLAVKKLSQDAAKRALDASPIPNTSLTTAGGNPPDYYSGGETSPAGDPVNTERKDSNDSSRQTPPADSQTLINKATKDRGRTTPKSVQGPSHALPVSTSPAGFSYRRTTSGSSSSSLDSTPYPQALEAAKAQAVKRLSFTASGNVKFGSRTPLIAPRLPADPAKQASPSKQTARKQLSPEVTKITSNSSAGDVLPPKDVSGASGVLADGQCLPHQAGITEHGQSTPSTNLLETDKQSVKFPSTEEGDSDAQFSTQAAVIKAQRSFQTELVSPLKEPSMRSATLQQMQVPGPIGRGITADNTKAAITPFRTFHKLYAEPSEGTYPQASDEVAMSTQAMIDAATPFTRSTIKKPAPKKKASFVPSPTEGKDRGNEDDVDGGFGKLVETSPDISNNEAKPPPNAPSAQRSLSKQSSSMHLQFSPAFSIAPNGTLTEVYQQDGQRPATDWDLNAVIDDAGSFLGSWDVNHELNRGKVSSYGKAISEGGNKR
ncbi:MAG: hypothetical protein FRX48_08622 [Lasallia pustulata]|uniref:Uncharacterized protein n=1 Tax=Lasallia pustulata TaxID=136370 RepID=A0A5M8PFZ2_9LECA|nr:MAG: hypothetical protein FRX48_08622 [Lasallia pustulata]